MSSPSRISSEPPGEYEEQLVAAFDRYLPAMLRLTGGSSVDLIKACAAIVHPAPNSAAEALLVRLFRSVIAYGRRRPSRSGSKAAMNGSAAFSDRSEMAADGHALLARSRSGGRSLEKEAIRRILCHAIDDLGPAIREVVVLRDVAGLRTADVQAILVLSQRKQSALLRHGRFELCAALGRELAAQHDLVDVTAASVAFAALEN